VLIAISAGICLAVEERNTVQKSFAVSGQGAKLIVDTVDGSIRVTGYSGTKVDVTVNELWRGDNSDKLQEAHKEIRLDMTQEGNTIRLYVDGPFRCRGNCGGWNGDRGYSARFDFDVKVPVEAILDLHTVNGGRVEVENVEGDFSVRNVNGSISMKGLAGSGAAHTVNGGVALAFKRNPKEACSLKTVNGAIDAAFQPGLSADLRVKTFNGEAWTDFDAQSLPSAAANAERRGTRYVYKRDRESRLRVGSGGPEHSFETLNGSIHILNKGL
jgi:DUF4097 and DUF4098 domain-containing protein YvlB